jgi:Secretion system C-terminal sorting domain
MKNFTKKYTLFILLLSLLCQVSFAQFQTMPVRQTESTKHSSAKIQAITLPFFDDFSTSINRPDITRWERGGGTFVSNTFTTNHPSINVVTFDGYKADGTPYDFNNPLAEGAIDTLTSQPIDLSKKSLPDSLYLSFFYAKGALGERPDSKDSLKLQFYTNGAKWETIWSDSGTVVNNFKQILKSVNKTIYLHADFKFRFISIGKRSGQFDVWHLDYVYLGEKRNTNDKYTKDYACRKFNTTLLKRYNSMPMVQFSVKKEAELTDSIKVEYFNLTNSFNNLNAGISITNQINKKIESDSLQKNGKGLQTNSQSFSSGFIQFKNQISKVLVDNEKAKIMVKIGLKTGDNVNDKIPNRLAANDTISQYTELDNYYAYDDGTAEQAAYVKKGFARVAVRYILNKPDAVTAIRINFQPSITNLTGKRITFQILANKNGKPGYPLQTISDSTTLIKYTNTTNGFIEYKIKQVAVEDTFYVGYVQLADEEPIVVGLDANSPQFSDNHFYNISNEWVQVPKTNAPLTSNNFVPIKGSLMIRPVMLGQELKVTLANEEEIQDKNLVISPNPSTGFFRWNDTSLKNAEVFDMTGRAIFQEKTNTQEINLQNLNSGVYFLRLSNEKNTFVRKIVKE